VEPCNTRGNFIMNGNTIHGHAQKFNLSPEYRAWLGMKARCYNPNELKYKDYGARGIKVCVEWFDRFEVFLAAVGPRPSGNHSLGRLNNDGDYAPGNVAWQTPVEQANNRRPKSKNANSRSGIVGISWVASRNSWRAGIYRQGCTTDLYYGKDFFEACCARKSAEVSYGILD
jgi:hypothetical protein